MSKPFKNKRRNGKRRPRKNNKRKGVNFEQRLTLSRESKIMKDTTLVMMTFDFADAFPYTGAGELPWSGNSIFDPGTAVSANYNALGWLQWGSLYGSYRVLSSTITMRLMATGGVAVSTNAYCTIFPSNRSAGTDNVLSAMGQPYVKSSYFNQAGGMSRCRIRNHISTAKVFGQPIMQDPKFASLFTAHPDNEWVWMFNIYDPSGTMSNSVEYQVNIVYKVLLFDRLPQAQTNVMTPLNHNVNFARFKFQDYKPKHPMSLYRTDLCNTPSLEEIKLESEAKHDL